MSICSRQIYPRSIGDARFSHLLQVMLLDLPPVSGDGASHRNRKGDVCLGTFPAGAGAKMRGQAVSCGTATPTAGARGREADALAIIASDRPLLRCAEMRLPHGSIHSIYLY